MIAEFAVEPRVMAQWQHFQSLHDDFGVSRGRFLCRYPGTWAKDVAQLAHQFTQNLINTPLNAKRIEEHLFSDVFKRKLVPARRPYDKARHWLANATGLSSGQAFDAIVADENPDRHPRVLVASEFLKSELPYHVETGGKVGRTAKELAACARPLLRVSNELVLVEPNFRVVDDYNKPVDRFMDTLEELMRQRREMPHPIKRLELHLKRPRQQIGATRIREDIEWWFTKRMPEGMAITVFLWQEKICGERLHPRFLLTEYGGIQFDYGLDEGKPGEKTVVTLLPEELWLELRRDYSREGVAFAIDPSTDIFEIRGT